MTDDLREKARHATHEMVGFLEIHRELHPASGPLSRHSNVVVHALRTAYATHVRNLLEFFHEKVKGDVVYGDLVGSDNPFKASFQKWPELEQGWWEQASKLASHLAGNRSDFKDLGEWEDRGCEEVLVPMIRHAAEKIPSQLQHEGLDGPAVMGDFLEWQAGLAL